MVSIVFSAGINIEAYLLVRPLHDIERNLVLSRNKLRCAAHPGVGQMGVSTWYGDGTAGKVKVDAFPCSFSIQRRSRERGRKAPAPMSYNADICFFICSVTRDQGGAETSSMFQPYSQVSSHASGVIQLSPVNQQITLFAHGLQSSLFYACLISAHYYMQGNVVSWRQA